MRRAVFLSAIVLAGLARGVAAQQAPGRPAQRLIDSVTTLVTASAAPRTIQVFVVPVPVSFRPDRTVDYTVVPTGGATIIPPLHGIVAAGGGEARSVMVAASVPAGALAGPRTVAAVEFSQGGTTVPVALELQVSRTRSASVRLAQQLYGAQPRERVTIPYLVTNTGNAPDTFYVSVVAPSQWTHSGPPTQRRTGGGGDDRRRGDGDGAADRRGWCLSSWCRRCGQRPAAGLQPKRCCSCSTRRRGTWRSAPRSTSAWRRCSTTAARRAR